MKMRSIILVAMSLILGSCSHHKNKSDKVAAKLKTKEGKEVGKVTFKGKGEVITIDGDFKNLKPNAQMGIHIHEVGDCSNNFQETGDHFDPTYKIHGHPKSDNTHAGDLGNVNTDQNGKADYFISKEDLSIQEDKYDSIVGKSIIIHSKKDDFETQPSGNSGEKYACGVIERI